MEIPAAFAARKREITAALAAPDGEYHDRSPKGSVDADIRDLIALLNGLDGIVTTSSCAGRVSLFVEGNSGPKPSAGSTSAANPGPSTSDAATGADPAAKRRGGLGGRWLFVTHTPDELALLPGCIRGLVDLDQQQSALAAGVSDDGPLAPDVPMPLIRLQFEPMILHIQTASLAHAQPILAAAVNAGWRESGVNSLRCLADPTTAFPIVAVRSAGLALGGVVGYTAPDDGHAVFLVDARYIDYMTERFRERFNANRQRIARFEENVRKTLLPLPSRLLKSHSAKREMKEGKAARMKDHDRGGEAQGLEGGDILDGLEMFNFDTS